MNTDIDQLIQFSLLNDYSQDINRNIETVANIKVTDAIKERVNELGLSNLAQDADVKIIVEDRLWKLAVKVVKPILIYEKEDYKNAINFLEVFSLFAGSQKELRTPSALNQKFALNPLNSLWN